jgi:hypothetical protein
VVVVAFGEFPGASEFFRSQRSHPLSFPRVVKIIIISHKAGITYRTLLVVIPTSVDSMQEQVRRACLVLRPTMKLRMAEAPLDLLTSCEGVVTG